jgi:redox-sensitive bicupin YhaK (pirin superfamily)
MLTLRKSQDRGYADHGWLKSYHSFSFAGYHDPRHMGFGNLRVINEDRIAPGTGFGTHGHRDMEIISYVLSGQPGPQGQHGQRQGHSARRRAAHERRHRRAAQRVQPRQGQTTHFLQIWIEPNVTGIPPSYEQKTFAAAKSAGRLRLVASPDGAEGSVTIHADASLYAGLFDGANRQLPLDPKRKAYVHLVRGELQVNGQSLTAGDAALLENESRLAGHGKDAEVLVFDLAA